MAKKLPTLALAKGAAMAGIAFAVTGSVWQTAIIAIVSAIITGIFLIINTFVQHRLTQRDLDMKVTPKQDEIIARVESLRTEVKEE